MITTTPRGDLAYKMSDEFDLDVFVKFTTLVKKGGNIAVYYNMKNRGKSSFKLGRIDYGWPGGEYTSPAIHFNRTDGSYMTVRPNERWGSTDPHEIGLFTYGPYPFVGTVTEITAEQ
jgi:hypothetical protein